MRGELAATTDALTQTTVYSYSALAGQVTAIERPDESLAFRYDSLGRRETMSDSVGTTSFVYDPLGRMTTVTDTFGVTLTYGYDAAGNRTELVYPGARTVSYEYDPLQRLHQVTDWESQSTTYGYDVLGRLEEVARPNGVETTFGYDNAHRLEDLWHVDTGGPTTLAHYAYSYDDVGNRSGAVEVTGGVTTSIAYQYDPLYRLTEATYTGGSRNGDLYEYGYDAVGNRTGAVEVTGGVTTTTAYTYDNANRITAAGGQSYSYDANGNLTSDSASSYAYDSANRLASVTQGGTTSTYRYNALGNRLQQATSGVTTTYLLDLNQPLVQVLSDDSSDYLYGVGRIGEYEGADWAYHLGDALGSVRLTTNITGTLTGHAHYAPFGEVLAGSTVEGSFGFAGEQTDVTGLQYLRARYYAPGMGGFTTRDIWDGASNLPATQHSYSYVLNNPVNFTDPSGWCAMHIKECEVALRNGQRVGLDLHRRVRAGEIKPVEAFARLADWLEIQFTHYEPRLPKDHQNVFDNTVWAMTILLMGSDPNEVSPITHIRVPFWTVGINRVGRKPDSIYGLGLHWLPYQVDKRSLQRGDWCERYYDDSANQANHLWLFVAVGYYDIGNSFTAGLGNEIHDPWYLQVLFPDLFARESGISLEDWRLSKAGIKLSEILREEVRKQESEFSLGKWIRENLKEGECGCK